MMDRIKRLFRDEEGATMVEYGLMIALIAVVCLLVVGALGTKVAEAFNSAQEQIPGSGPVTPR